MPTFSRREGLEESFPSRVPDVSIAAKMKTPARRFYHLFAVCLLVVCSISPSRSAAQTQLPSTLVIDGGTLIDGNGGAPLRDALVVIQGNKITTVSRKGQTAYPANAQVIHADGKFIIPGLWDSHGVPMWYQNELLLSHGITSETDVGTGGELGKILRDAINNGKLVAPRRWASIGSPCSQPIARSGLGATGYEGPLFVRRVPKSVDEARELAKRFFDAGSDYLFVCDGNLPVDYYQAMMEEANKFGKPLYLEQTNAKAPLTIQKAAEVGISALPHSPGVAEAAAKDPSKWTNELDLYSEMDDTKATELIQLLVQKKVALIPNFVHGAAGYPEGWKRFGEEDRKVFSDPDLLSYYPHASMAAALLPYSFPPPDQAVFDRRRQGYLNMLRFHRELIDAGGHVLTGGNTNETKTPGMSIHHELEAFVEAGISPMHAIQGATKWAAEAMRVQDKLGTIESGKLADIVIVGGDPLADIRNIHRIDGVIFNGKVVELGYHAWFGDPFMSESEYTPVEKWIWVAQLKQTTIRRRGGEGGGFEAGSPISDPVESPQPAIESIAPTIVTEGSPTTTITLKGFNFVRRTRVFFEGRAVPFRRVTPTELKLTLDETFLRSPGKFDIVVKNPAPLANPEWGNGTSNVAHLLVNYR